MTFVVAPLAVGALLGGIGVHVAVQVTLTAATFVVKQTARVAWKGAKMLSSFVYNAAFSSDNSTVKEAQLCDKQAN
jgi:hypothetical protein